MHTKRFRPRLTYANTMSTLAVMIALGGTSYAATQLSRGSVTTRALRNGAVQTGKLANGAVTNLKLADGAVVTRKLSNSSVTNSKLAPGSVTEPKVLAGSLTGEAFKCDRADVGLDNRRLCAFKVTGPFKNWIDAVHACSGRGRTPGVLASAGEIAAFAGRGGSPFNGPETFWTSSPSGGAPSPTSSAWVVGLDANSKVFFLSTPIEGPVGADAACVYHAADYF